MNTQTDAPAMTWNQPSRYADLTPADKDWIVVGHDGSSHADHALETALELAKAFGAGVLLVRAWTIDTLQPGHVMRDGAIASYAEISEQVTEELRAQTERICAATPSVATRYRGVLGQPAEALIAIADDARMLVVGSRGRGGFSSLLLGSVSEQCMHHATCPVLVVRQNKST